MVLRRVDSRNSSSGADAASDPVMAEGFPSLLEYMVVTAWEPGKPREVATLLLVAEGGKWKLQVRDRANKRATWFSSDTVQGCLQLAEKALREDTADWRAERPWSSGGKRG